MNADKTVSALLHDIHWQNYQRRTDMVASIKEDMDFYAGKQWPDNNFSNMPRAVLNYIHFGIKQIASKINGTPLYLTFASSDGETDCSALRRFDEFVRKQADSTAFDLQSYINGENLGTEITYMFWDADSETVGGFYKGGLRMEHISPLSFAVANPRQPDIQRQEWVMIWTDWSVGQCKAVAKQSQWTSSQLHDIELKLQDEAKRTVLQDDINVDKDILNDALLRVYIRFFRVNGEVCFTEETETVSLLKYPMPLSTEVSKNFAKKLQDDFDKAREDGDLDEDGRFVKDYAMDFEAIIGNPTRENNTEKDHRKIKERFSLYPFALFRPIPLDNCIFGASKTSQMIPIQKAINWEVSMTMKAAENNAYNKIYVKEDALQGQEITNEPGQIIVDYSRNLNGWGIKMGESQPMPNDLTNHESNLVSQMKEANGFSDVMTGNISNSDISGYAVQQMIKQNNTPIEQEQLLAWKYQKDLARIRIMYYKHYLHKSYYTYDYTDGEYEDIEFARNAILYGIRNGKSIENTQTGQPIPNELILDVYSKPSPKSASFEFDGDAMWGIDFEVSIDAQQGLADSKLTEEQAWDNMVLNGGIAKLSADQLELYIKGNPAFSPSFKEEIGRYIKQLKRGQIAQLQQQLQQAQMQIQQLGGQLQGQATYNQQLNKEFSDKINVANRLNKSMADQLAKASQAQQGVTQGEVKSNNSRGIGGSTLGATEPSTL